MELSGLTITWSDEKELKKVLNHIVYFTDGSYVDCARNKLYVIGDGSIRLRGKYDPKKDAHIENAQVEGDLIVKSTPDQGAMSPTEESKSGQAHSILSKIKKLFKI